METFITKYNAKRLVYEMEKVNVDINQEIILFNFIWFGEWEIREILSFKLLYEDPEEFFKRYKKQEFDTKRYVFEGHPAYHKDFDCPKLTSDFTNVKIPEEIRNRGDKAIKEFREWYKENSYLLERDSVAFYARLRLRFRLESNPEIVEKKNSGVTTHESLKLDNLEQEIKEIIHYANAFYLRSYKNRVILDNFGKISFISENRKPPNHNNTEFTNDEIWEVLKDFHVNYKSRIKNLLIEYYRIHYNPKLSFDGIMLDQLGFKKCGYCFEVNDVVDLINFPNYDDDLPF